MILEGIVTTVNLDGSANVAPMGPYFPDNLDSDQPISAFAIKPFTSSRTYANLARSGRGIFHVTDCSMALAQAAVGKWLTPPHLEWRDDLQGWLLSQTCRWMAFTLTSHEAEGPRASLNAVVTQSQNVREFFGWNRGQFAVLELSILATRRHMLPPEDIVREMERLRPLVEKTGGQTEKRAFDFLTDFLHDTLHFPA